MNNVKNQDVVDKWDFGFLLSKLETLQTTTKKQLDYTVKNLTESLANINKELYKEKFKNILVAYRLYLYLCFNILFIQSTF